MITACSTAGQDQIAYNHVVGSAIADPAVSLCYYKPAGCEGASIAGQPALSSTYNGRPKIPYPRDGYVLGNDGLYWFEPLYLSRKGR